MIEPDTVEYLASMAERVSLHKKTKEATVRFLQKNNIDDRRIIENCIVSSQVWAADCFGRGITNSEILIFLGEEDIEVHDDDNGLIYLKPELKGLNLNELLTTVSTMSGSVFK